MALGELFKVCSLSGQSCKVGSLEDPCQDSFPQRAFIVLFTPLLSLEKFAAGITN